MEEPASGMALPTPQGGGSPSAVLPVSEAPAQSSERPEVIRTSSVVRRALPKSADKDDDAARPAESVGLMSNAVLVEEEDPMNQTQAISSKPPASAARGSTAENKPSFMDKILALRTKGPLATFLCIHAISTLIVFQHFFIKKWYAVDAAMPINAPHYWVKHIIPPIEFGAMHCLLLQLALLPVTMCRYFSTVLRETWLRRFIPFDYLPRIHIYLGYVMGAQLTAAFILFLCFFGPLCVSHLNGNEPVDFCAKLRSEIFITGIVIVVLYYIMFVTAAPFLCKKKKTYEIFYYTHHIFLILYPLIILHTLDNEARDGLVRSQDFPWLLGSMFLYMLDRLIFAASRKRSKIIGALLCRSPDAMVLTIEKPPGFGFRAGQYVQVHVPKISKLEWHPFSIASTNDDKHIRLYIRVIEDGWTQRLFQLLEDIKAAQSGEAKGTGAKGEMISMKGHDYAGGLLEVQLMGPYGAALEDLSVFDHVTLVSGGSGVVPMLSQLGQVLSQFVTIAETYSPDGKIDLNHLLTEFRKEKQSRNRKGTLTKTGTRPKLAKLLQMHRYHLFTFICMLLDFAFIWLPISWLVNNIYSSTANVVNRVEFDTILGVYLLDLAARVVLRQYQQNYRTAMVVLNSVEAAGVITMLCICAVDYAGAFSDTQYIIATSILRFFRTAVLLHNNRLAQIGLPDAVQSYYKRRGKNDLLQSIIFVWAVPNMSSFCWLHSELEAVQEKFDEHLGKGFLDVQVFVSRATEKEIQEEVSGTALEGRVHVGKPNWKETLIGIRNLRLEEANIQGDIGATGVLCCGKPSLSYDVKLACVQYMNKYRDVPITFLDGGEHTVTIKF